MLMPSKVKYRKQQRGHRRGVATRGNTIVSGEYGLVALENCWMTSRQIEAARVAMTRYIKRAGKVWIRIFPDKPVTAKPAETRMGSGKGSPEYWVAVIKRGRVLFEMSGVTPDLAKEAMRKAAHKLPIRTRLVLREELAGESERRPPPLRQMTLTELREQLEKDRQELFNLRFQAATQQLENPRRVREVRRNIARLLTLLHEREGTRAGR